MGGKLGRDLPMPKDFPTKYAGSGAFDQMSVALVGTCISPSLLSGTAKQRSGSDDNLEGIVEDGRNMYSYFRGNGARIALYSFSVPAPPPSQIKESIKEFLQSPGNVKVLYLSGHGDRDGDLVLGEGVYLSTKECLTWLAEARFGGMITFIIDACYSGMWAQNVSELIHKRTHSDAADVFYPLRDRAVEGGGKTMINCRLSSLPGETSRDGGSRRGGRYTTNLLWYLQREWRWSKEAAGANAISPAFHNPGWGSKELFKHRPNNEDAVFSISKSEPQSDIIFDVVIKHDGSTAAYFPQDRKKYIMNAMA